MIEKLEKYVARLYHSFSRVLVASSTCRFESLWQLLIFCLVLVTSLVVCFPFLALC